MLSGWRHWGNGKDAKEWWGKASTSDVGLLKLISAYASEITSQTAGEYAVRTKLRVNPKSIEPYGDIEVMSDRVKNLLDAAAVEERFKPAAMRFVYECQCMKEGKNPDAFDFDDDGECE